MAKLATPRPFLKWAGGKTQLVNDLIKYAPLHFGAYHEPFVGGGAMFFEMARQGMLRCASISDLNAELIDTFTTIRDCVEEVIELLSVYPYNKEFFYALRAKDPWKLDLTERAARMIYLNKTCYNGLYRVNRNGKFNVPFGRYKSPKYCDPVNLRAVSVVLRDVDIFCESFERIIDRAKPGDFVYFDPPYQPISDTASFTAYQPNGFSQESQRLLRDVCIELTQRGVQVMVSNSDADLIRTLYAPSNFTINEVQANRAINSNPKKRGKLAELIVTNYSIDEVTQLRRPKP